MVDSQEVTKNCTGKLCASILQPSLVVTSDMIPHLWCDTETKRLTLVQSIEFILISWVMHALMHTCVALCNFVLCCLVLRPHNHKIILYHYCETPSCNFYRATPIPSPPSPILATTNLFIFSIILLFHGYYINQVI